MSTLLLTFAGREDAIAEARRLWGPDAVVGQVKDFGRSTTRGDHCLVGVMQGPAWDRGVAPLGVGRSWAAAFADARRLLTSGWVRRGP